ncbi:zinc finger Y-chromosomal protein 1-like [Stigmatopora argus]
MAAEALDPGSWLEAVETDCHGDVAHSRDAAVQTDPPSRRRLGRRRVGVKGPRAPASARLPASPRPRPAEATPRPRPDDGGAPAPPDGSGEAAAEEAWEDWMIPLDSPPARRPQRTRRPPKWRQVEVGLEEGAASEAEAETETEAAVCHVCGQVMKSKASLSRHFFIHTGQKPFACHLCGLRFNRRDNLRHHLTRLHPGGVACRERRPPGPTWLCHVCGKTFRCRSALRTHEVIHLGVKPHRCDLCPKAYMRTNDLEHHRATVHGEGEGGADDGRRRRPARGSLLCHFCGKELKFRSQLAAHLLTHTDERPHLCDVCGRKFARRYQLERHKDVRHAERPGTEEARPAVRRLRCALCPRRFCGPARLERHGAREHPEEVGGGGDGAARLLPPKVFPCATCGKEFKFPSLLNNHAAVHSQERPHACDLCPRRFRRPGHLKRHRRVVHLDGARLPQNFVCHVCGEDKKCRSQLARHVIVHTDERPFACDVCAARFNRQGNLQQHRRRVHGADPAPTDADEPLLVDSDEPVGGAAPAD